VDTNSGRRRDSGRESEKGRELSSTLAKENSDAWFVVAGEADVEIKETARKRISKIYTSNFVICFSWINGKKNYKTIKRRKNL
jgi:hypothetical protein